MDWEVLAVSLTGAFGVVGVVSAIVTSRQATRLAELNANAPVVVDAIHRRNAAYAELLEFTASVGSLLTYPKDGDPDELEVIRNSDKHAELREKLQFSATSRLVGVLLLSGSPAMSDALGLFLRLTQQLVAYIDSGGMTEIFTKDAFAAADDDLDSEDESFEENDIHSLVMFHIELRALIPHGIGLEVRGQGLLPSDKPSRARGLPSRYLAKGITGVEKLVADFRTMARRGSS